MEHRGTLEDSPPVVVRPESSAIIGLGLARREYQTMGLVHGVSNQKLRILPLEPMPDVFAMLADGKVQEWLFDRVHIVFGRALRKCRNIPKLPS